MNHLRNQTADERTRQILEDLEAVRENLFALSDDIWLSIEHNDQKALEEGFQFKQSYNEKMAAFNRLAGELAGIIQQYTAVTLEEAEQTGAGERERNERIILELNREEKHKLDEDFTFKRPHGFILDGQGTTGITTWKRLYALLCQQLLRRDPNRFRALLDNPDFISKQGNHYFSRDEGEFWSASLIGDGIYAETTLSAKEICRRVRQLLSDFEIPMDRLDIFLRQDRNAGRDGDAT